MTVTLLFRYIYRYIDYSRSLPNWLFETINSMHILVYNKSNIWLGHNKKEWHDTNLRSRSIACVKVKDINMENDFGLLLVKNGSSTMAKQLERSGAASVGISHRTLHNRALMEKWLAKCINEFRENIGYIKE